MAFSIDLIAPALPPQLDGIGDHTALLAQHLSQGARVTIRTADDFTPTAIPGVRIVPAFTRERPRSVNRLVPQIAQEPPDWVFLQFNQFSYGRWGLNPFLPLAMRAIKRRCPRTRFALLSHEDFVPTTSWKFAVMTTWQRWQLWMLGRTADVVFFSIDPWVDRFKPWFPGKPVLHLPVGSNIPFVQMEREQARRRLNIPADVSVLGLFGTARDLRMLELIRTTAQAVAQAAHKVLVLYVGPHGATVREILGEVTVLAEGPLPAVEVSRRLSAVDVFLAPYIDGVSTRRGAFMAGLQHGLPTVSTNGFQTDGLLRAQAGSAFLLAEVEKPEEFVAQTQLLLDRAALRQDISMQAQDLYRQEFGWDRIANRLFAALDTFR